ASKSPLLRPPGRARVSRRETSRGGVAVGERALLLEQRSARVDERAVDAEDRRVLLAVDLGLALVEGEDRGLAALLEVDMPRADHVVALPALVDLRLQDRDQRFEFLETHACPLVG